MYNYCEIIKYVSLQRNARRGQNNGIQGTHFSFGKINVKTIIYVAFWVKLTFYVIFLFDTAALCNISISFLYFVS